MQPDEKKFNLWTKMFSFIFPDVKKNHKNPDYCLTKYPQMNRISFILGKLGFPVMGK